MANLTVSQDIDSLMNAANKAAIQSVIGTAYVYVEAYDNGSRTDIEQLDAAFAACQTGGTIVLKAGKTYTLTRTWSISRACRIDLNGATLTRANQVTTTLSSNASSGATTLSVADASGFTIGERIAIIGGTGGTDVKSLSVGITNIVGNTITCTATTGNATSGNTVLREVALISSSAIIEVFNGTFDGNVSGNTATEAWQLNSGIASTDRVYVHDVVVLNNPGEFIFCPSGSLIEKIRATDLKGSIVHVSDSASTPFYRGVWLSDIYGKNVCQSTVSGHNESWFTASANTWDVAAENIRIENCGTAALPNFDSNDSRGTFRNMLIDGCGASTTISASTSDVAIGYVTVEDCKFINCKDFLFAGKSLKKGYCVRDIVFRDCSFQNARMNFSQALNISLNDCTFDFTSDYTAASAVGADNGVICFRYFDRVTLRGLKINGPEAYQAGMFIGVVLSLDFETVRKLSDGSSTNHLYPVDVTVEDLSVANLGSGIATYQSVNAVVTKSVVGWRWNNIRVWSYKETAGVAAGNYVGVQVPAGCHCSNVVVHVQFSTQNHGYYPIHCYGIDSTGSTADCRGALLDNATVYVVQAQSARIVGIGGSTSGRSNYNIITRDIKTTHTTMNYALSVDAARQSLEAMTNIGATAITSFTSEDYHQFYGVLEAANQY